MKVTAAAGLAAQLAPTLSRLLVTRARRLLGAFLADLESEGLSMGVALTLSHLG